MNFNKARLLQPITNLLTLLVSWIILEQMENCFLLRNALAYKNVSNFKRINSV
jgi:hypothetical protein